MVITQIIGGLGNQMFQYALGRNLSQKLKCELKIDTRPFSWYKLHKYSLHHFAIPQEVASEQEIKKVRYGTTRPAVILGIDLVNKFSKKILKRELLPLKNLFTDTGEAFKAEVLRHRGDVMLEGYWQSEKYFSECRDLLVNDFAVVTAPSDNNKRLLDRIGACNSVSIHIRRGDYVSNPETQKIHGVCSVAYYEKAVETIRRRVKSPHFFIFSDDAEWAEANLKISDSTIVKGNDADHNYEDLRLIYSCRHNIIANSSFSWWGAWLNQNSEKIVIAPAIWAASSVIETKDIVPESWERLSA